MSDSILIIEDNDINMDVLISMVQDLGLIVIPALNGPAGLAIAKGAKPTIILCDIQMPELDGFGVLAGVRSDPKIAHTPVIAVTAPTTGGDAQRLLAAGFDGYLSKPVCVECLKNALSPFLVSEPSVSHQCRGR